MPAPPHFVELSEAVEACGFVVRGGFHTRSTDGLPADVMSVVLVGNVGEKGFASFRNSAEWARLADPMDRYTERIIGALAERWEARVAFPQQGPPWWPFQRWAMRAETVFVSPLQILIHPQHGLWHAYRAALLFAERVPGLPRARQARQNSAETAIAATDVNPCTHCSAQPCLSACPVDAYSAQGFDRARCERHLLSPAGRSCLDDGCAARNACPASPFTRYGKEQRQFHMRAFLASVLAPSPLCTSPKE